MFIRSSCTAHRHTNRQQKRKKIVSSTISNSFNEFIRAFSTIIPHAVIIGLKKCLSTTVWSENKYTQKKWFGFFKTSYTVIHCISLIIFYSVYHSHNNYTFTILWKLPSLPKLCLSVFEQNKKDKERNSDARISIESYIGSRSTQKNLFTLVFRNSSIIISISSFPLISFTVFRLQFTWS